MLASEIRIPRHLSVTETKTCDCKARRVISRRSTHEQVRELISRNISYSENDFKFTRSYGARKKPTGILG
jgi:hypothetical protein